MTAHQKGSSAMHRLLGRAALGVASVALVLVAGASPAAAAEGPAFLVNLYANCVIATGTPTAVVPVSQLTSSGSVLETRNGNIGGDGTVQVCFDASFLPGMKVRGTNQGITRTFTVPKLTIKADRTTDIVSGKAPAGRAVHVGVWHYSTLVTSAEHTWNRTASSTGSWSVDTTSSFNLIGGDLVSLRYDSGVDSATLWGYVPRLSIRIGSSRVEAALLVNTGGTVSLRSSTGTVRGTAFLGIGHWAVEGWAANRFVDSYGSAVGVRVGDKVSAPFQPSMSFTVPNLTISANTSTDVISGSCPASRRLQVMDVKGNVANYLTATCSAGGTYAVDMTSVIDVASGDRALVRVRLAAGDIVERTKLVP